MSDNKANESGRIRADLKDSTQWAILSGIFACFALSALLFSIMAADLMLPGKSIFQRFSPATRAVLGGGGGSVCLLCFVLIVLRLDQPTVDRLRKLFQIYCVSCLFPIGLFLIGNTEYRTWLFQFYLSKVLTIFLLAPAFFVSSRNRKRGVVLIRACLRSTCGLAVLIYLAGDSLLWLCASEVHVNSQSLWTVGKNAILVGSMSAIWVGALGRARFGVLLWSATMLAFYVATFFKVLLLHAPVMANDILSIRELLIVLPDVLGRGFIVWVGVGFLSVLCVGYFTLRRSQPLKSKPRALNLLIGGALFTVMFGAIRQDISTNWSPLWRWSVNGTWVCLVDDLKHWSFSAVKPVGYDAETARELSKSASTGFRPGNDQQVRPNVIFLLVESLIDLRDIGLDVSPDPQPFLHSVRGNGHDGVAIVSNICSGSSTTEFELLSGMEARMWPYPPIPYYSLRSRSINSIPRRWTDQSFSAAVMQVDPRNMYNRVLSYEKMGIGSVEWISEGAGTIGSDSGTGVGEALPGSAMDTILLNKMAEYVEEEDRPAFVFGFTNGTHSPYDGSEGNWSVSSGVVSDGIIASEIAGYCDEIVVADSLCKQFWERLKALDEHTVLVIVGDHMPPFRSRVGPYGVVSDDEYHLRLVPYVVLDTKVGAVAVPPRISTNMIPWWVMKYCGISFTDAFANVSLRALESSTVVSGGKTADRVVGDYRFLQYGILEDGIESVPAQEN